MLGGVPAQRLCTCRAMSFLHSLPPLDGNAGMDAEGGDLDNDAWDIAWKGLHPRGGEGDRRVRVTGTPSELPRACALWIMNDASCIMQHG